MRTEHFIAMIFAVLFLSCNDPVATTDIATEVHQFERVKIPVVDLEKFDLLQRTCALYVAVRSHAWKDEITFDREIDGSMVRWNMCDDKSMVACSTVPLANGDTIRTGIPWPYDPPDL